MDSDLAVQAYYDRSELVDEYSVDVADLELRHRYAAFARNEIVWGANYRHYHASHEQIALSASTWPSDEGIDMASAFVQDEISILPGLLRITIGSKLGWNEYSGFEYQPSGRILVTPHESHTLWFAVSRAVRMPSQAEASAIVSYPYMTVLPSSDPEAENVLAIEGGYRATPLPNVSVDVAAYYNDYEDLRTIDLIATGPPPTMKFGNAMESESWGVELALGWQVVSFLRLMGGYTFMDIDSEWPATSQLTDNPAHVKHQFNIRAFLDLPWGLTLDPQVFWVGRARGADGDLTYGDLLAPKTLDDFWRFDMRLGWAPRPGLEFALVGQNLNSAEHAEFGNQFRHLATRVPRSFYAKVAWRY